MCTLYAYTQVYALYVNYCENCIPWDYEYSGKKANVNKCLARTGDGNIISN